MIIGATEVTVRSGPGAPAYSNSCTRMCWYTGPSPRPPYSTGQFRPNQPLSPSLRPVQPPLGVGRRYAESHHRDHRTAGPQQPRHVGNAVDVHRVQQHIQAPGRPALDRHDEILSPVVDGELAPERPEIVQVVPARGG